MDMHITGQQLTASILTMLGSLGLTLALLLQRADALPMLAEGLHYAGLASLLTALVLWTLINRRTRKAHR
jgi:hypothetical protein